MNQCIFMGRLVNDPNISYSGEGKPIARYRLAVDRRWKDSEQSADFFNCVAFGKNAEFAERYLSKGIKISIVARAQSGSYKNRHGVTVYTTDFIVEQQEFCESKKSVENAQQDQDSLMAERDPEQGELPFAFD